MCVSDADAVEGWRGGFRSARSQMDVGIGEALAGDLDKSFHEVVIFFASHTTLS
jgi:hypothetical protein